MSELPSGADVVVVGGGVVGVSAACHLARAGVSVLLVERDELGSGSTVKAAGGVRAQFSDEVNIRLGQRSLEILGRFEELFDQAIDLHRTGYLFLLSTAEDAAVFERSVARQNALGVPSRMLSVEEAVALAPPVSADGLVAAAYSPEDGHCAPESVVLGYARAARRAGAVLVTHTRVTGVTARQTPDGPEVTGVDTTAGPVACTAVVVAAGAWSGEVGHWAGVPLPVTPLRRQVVVTEPVPDLPPERLAALPMTIDFATSYYFHAEGAGLLIGMSDPDETPGFRLDRDEAWLPRLVDAIERRTPQFAGLGIRTGWAGLYEMTPDHNGLVGRSGSVLYATGFSGHGFLMGPAVGEVVRDLYLGREPVVDVGALSADRFATGPRDPAHGERHIV